MKKMFIVLFVLVVTILTSACLQLDTTEVKVIEKTNTNTQNNDLDEKGEVLQADTEEYIKSIIKDRATEVLTALKDYDMEKLSQFVHPVKGVRFTPYAYVEAETNLVFSAEEIKSIGSDSTQYLWGSYDGSGFPIELTFEEYYKKFIYDVDFINAEKIGYNKSFSFGNSLNNSSQFYKNSIIVEYYFSGFEKQYEGMDWKGFRLVFEKMNDTWFIVGIIHDQWTI